MKADAEEMRHNMFKSGNENMLKARLHASNMSNEEIGLILGTLNDIQDKIKEEYEGRMSDFTPLLQFTEEKDENASLRNRLQKAETNVKELGMKSGDNAAGIVYVKKTCACFAF